MKLESTVYAVRKIWNDSRSIQDFYLQLAREGYIDIPSIPCLVYLVLTEKCFGGCLYCSANCVSTQRKELTQKEWFRVIDSLRRSGVREVVLSGGEPLLRRDFIEIFEYASKCFCRVQLLTNGVLITDELIKRICNSVHEYDTDLYIQVDIDSYRSEVHDFLRPKCPLKVVENNVNKLLKFKKDFRFEIWINTVLTRYNFDDIITLIEILDKKHIDGIKIVPMALVGRAVSMRNAALSGREKLALFHRINQLRKKLQIKVYYNPIESILLSKNEGHGSRKSRKLRTICSAAYISCVITSDGSICPCDLVIRNKIFRGESVLKEDFSFLWKNSVILNTWRRESASISECQECYLVHRCFNGCKAETFELLGTLNAKYPLCPLGEYDERRNRSES